MSSSDDTLIDGKPLSTLRVVDLKELLDERGLSKNGSKHVLISRLKEVFILFYNMHVTHKTFCRDPAILLIEQAISLEQGPKDGENTEEVPNMEVRTFQNT